MLCSCDVKLLVASCTCWRRSSERSPWASLIFDRSLLMALRLLCTPLTVTVETVRPLSSSTCLLMSARASQTVLLALSCLDSPQAPSASAARSATSRQVMVFMGSSALGAGRAQHAAKADVRRRGVDRLALPSGGAKAQAVVRGAQVRAALDDPPRDGLAGQH